MIFIIGVACLTFGVWRMRLALLFGFDTAENEPSKVCRVPHPSTFSLTLSPVSGECGWPSSRVPAPSRSSCPAFSACSRTPPRPPHSPHSCVRGPEILAKICQTSVNI